MDIFEYNEFTFQTLKCPYHSLKFLSLISDFFPFLANI